MKKHVLLIILMFFNTVICFSQEKDKLSIHDMATRQTEKMVKNYDLSKDQKTKVHAVNLSTAYDLTNLKKQKLEEAKYLKAKKNILDGQRIEVSKVLTAAQKSEFDVDNKKYDQKLNRNKK